jgi:hypothetical protein
MSDKKLSFLGVLAIISVVLAVYVSQFASRTKHISAGAGYLIQGLDPAKVSKIVIGKDANTFTLIRGQNGFTVENRSNYPAGSKTINNLFSSIMDIRTIEVYTENKANYKDLGVTEEQDSQAVVKFLDANSQIITGVIIGKDCPSGGTYYGRLVNDNKVYVMDNVPWPGSSPLEYIDKQLIAVNKANIASVTVTSPAGTYTLVPEANGTEAALKDLPAGKEERKEECDMVFSTLTELSFEDVNAVSQLPDLKFDREYACLLQDSTLFLIEIAQKDSKTFVKFNADFTDKTQVKKEEGVESQEELKKKEAKLVAKEKVRKFQDVTNGWIYQIPAVKGDSMTKKLSDIIENIPVSKPADANIPKEAVKTKSKSKT